MAIYDFKPMFYAQFFRNIFTSYVLLFLGLFFVVSSACLRPTYQDVTLLDCKTGDKIFVSYHVFCIYPVNEEGGGDNNANAGSSFEDQCQEGVPYPHRYQNVLLCSEFEEVDDRLLESAVRIWSRQTQNNTSHIDMSSIRNIPMDRSISNDTFILIKDFAIDVNDVNDVNDTTNLSDMMIMID
jgi:hypothetical protein